MIGSCWKWQIYRPGQEEIKQDETTDRHREVIGLMDRWQMESREIDEHMLEDESACASPPNRLLDLSRGFNYYSVFFGLECMSRRQTNFPSSSGSEDVYSLLALGRQAVSLRMGVPLLHYATAGVLGQVWGTEATSHQCSYSTHHRPPGTTWNARHWSWSEAGFHHSILSWIYVKSFFIYFQVLCFQTAKYIPLHPHKQLQQHLVALRGRFRCWSSWWFSSCMLCWWLACPFSWSWPTTFGPNCTAPGTKKSQRHLAYSGWMLVRLWYIMIYY